MSGGLTLTPVEGRAVRLTGDVVGLDGVLDALPHIAHPVRDGTGLPGLGWRWRDGRSRSWWPQGLELLSGERRVLLAAWYSRDLRGRHTGSRVTVLDLGPGDDPPRRPRYAHLTLVEPDGRPVTVHCGGLACWGHQLLVADTRRGLRGFDLRGVVRSGTALLLPQTGSWQASAEDGARPLRWSFVARDDDPAGGAHLVAGEYSRTAEGARLARFPLTDGRLRATEVFAPGIPRMQGACRVAGRYVVSASNGRRRGDLWHGTAADGFTREAGALPVGPEDLAHDPRTDRLWTQTEARGARAVWSVPVPD